MKISVLRRSEWIISNSCLVGVYNEINSVMTDRMLQFCEGSLTIDEAVDAIVEECNALLDEYHAAND